MRFDGGINLLFHFSPVLSVRILISKSCKSALRVLKRRFYPERPKDVNTFLNFFLRISYDFP